MKNRSILLWVCVFAVTACNKPQETKTNEQPSTTIAANDLPAMTITSLDGNQFSAKNLTGKNIIIMFQPDCDHCQREAKQIGENIKAFKDYQLYFVSSATREELQKFASEYTLDKFSNVHFGSTSVNDVINTYGQIETPSIYIYDDRKLIQKFNGEVEISEVVKHL
ncbi:peroxiredoxin family protein [Ohtaekwangia koreensis]|uniref:AhpC/TSA family protein n=1 Tax=Ohtaekwangia koreensis TaxID=688867 RepID=A0A1T5LJ17_9BACT|nr:redoxin domain-containing protein [Ohtaekwangia koreensis]SKC75982.1 AhpC/TSA family protein [Ohtaekwangia koreensis]